MNSGSNLNDYLEYGLIAFMMLFVVVSNGTCIRQTFAKQPEDLVGQCLSSVARNTAWKSACIVFIAWFASRLIWWSLAMSQVNDSLWNFSILDALAALSGIPFGLLTGLAAAHTSHEGVRTAQIAAGVAYVGQPVFIVTLFHIAFNSNNCI